MLAFGHEPIMSDQAEVIFDPQAHTHTSCLREVKNCDVVVLVIGSRFGGTIIPKALEQIDLEKINDMSRSEKFGEGGHKISITQAEILQAIQHGIPVFAFVDSGIMRDHLTYEKNKSKDIIGQIEFSSIDKPETAAYIFEFINFLRLRNENNSIFEFSRFEDIETQLKKQWSGLFQRLLSEQRLRSTDGRSIDLLSSQIADLKAAVLGSISNAELKDTAKGAIRFRSLIDFTYSLVNEIAPEKYDEIIRTDKSWHEILTDLGIIKMTQPDRSRDRYLTNAILIHTDGTYYRTRMPLARLYRFAEEWDDFKELGEDAKTAIISAIIDSRNGRASQLVTHFNEPYIEGAEKTDDPNEGVDTTTFGEHMERIESRKKIIEDSLYGFISCDPHLSKLDFKIRVKDDIVTIDTQNGETYRKHAIYYKPDDGNLDNTISSLKRRLKSILNE